MTDYDTRMVENLVALANEWKLFRVRVDALFLPNVKVDCPAASPQPIEVHLGGWDGTAFTSKMLAEVTPGSAYGYKLDSIQEFSDFKKGHSLLLRVKEGVGLYNLTNAETYFGYALTVSPPVFPWWPPHAKAVRWGPNAPYLVNPSQTIYSYLTPDLQDVFYYFTPG